MSRVRFAPRTAEEASELKVDRSWLARRTENTAEHNMTRTVPSFRRIGGGPQRPGHSRQKEKKLSSYLETDDAKALMRLALGGGNLEHEVASSSDSSEEDGCAKIFETYGMTTLCAAASGAKRNALGFMADFAPQAGDLGLPTPSYLELKSIKTVPQKQY